MPSSYQAPTRGDKKENVTTSQSLGSNTKIANATVERLLKSKGDAVFSIESDKTLADAVVVLSEKRIGALVVTDDQGSLIGILSERDIVRKLAETPGQTLPNRVESVMTTKIQTCTKKETLVSLLKRMTEGRFRHMTVVEDNQLLGMITIGDVVNFRINELEHEALQLKQLIVG